MVNGLLIGAFIINLISVIIAFRVFNHNATKAAQDFLLATEKRLSTLETEVSFLKEQISELKIRMTVIQERMEM